jgi:hypothetical protein
MSELCQWITKTGNQCKCLALMDNMCSRHLKQTCSICLEPVRSTNSQCTKRLSCGHSHHMKCILGWFVTSDICPVCRKKQTNEPLLKFKDDIEENMRNKYKDLIHTHEVEMRRLRETVRRLSNPR